MINEGAGFYDFLAEKMPARPAPGGRRGRDGQHAGRRGPGEAANPRGFVSATVPADQVQILAKTPEMVVAAIEAVVHHSR